MENHIEVSPIGEIAKNYGLNFSGVKLNTKKDNIVTFLATKTGCDCSSSIGKDFAENRFDESKERQKLTRKRFSKSRIEKLLEQKKQRVETNLQTQLSAEKDELNNWTSFLQEIKRKKLAEKIGVLFHNFKGEFDGEAVHEFETTTGKLTDTELKNLSEDELKWFYLK
jgi:exonuclease VII large subunit